MNDKIDRVSKVHHQKARLLHQVSISLACSVIGWVALVAYSFCTYYTADLSSWFMMPYLIAFTSPSWVAGVWLLFVLPVFLTVRPSSWFWRFPVTPVIFGSLDVLILASRTRFNPAFYPEARFWLITGIAGCTTGLAASIFQRRLHRKITRAEHLVDDNLS